MRIRRPPGPKSRNLLLGMLPQLKKDPPVFLERIARQYGDLAFFRLSGQSVYLINHPDWVRDILVTHQSNFTKTRILERSKVLLGEGLLTSEGEFHTRQRRLVQPAFHRDRLVRYGEAMVESAVKRSEDWDARLAGGRELEIDLALEMPRLTLAIVAKTLFSADVSGEADEVGEALNEIFALFDKLLLPFADLMRKLRVPSARRFERARDRLDKVVYGLIAERRASRQDTGDLLSMLLLAQDEEAGAGPKTMTDRQVRDEVMTLMIAGHETTANALLWTWYLLSQNPTAEAALHEELKCVLNGRAPTFDDLGRLPYTTGVFAEALRLFPPAWAISRRNKQDYELADYSIPAKSILLTSPWIMHRDPRWWPEPLKFDPGRWTSEPADARPKFAFFPFGGGTRVCIGERFAWAEGVLVLAVLAQKWRMKLVPGHPVATRAAITLRSRYGMRMILEPRN